MSETKNGDFSVLLPFWSKLSEKEKEIFRQYTNMIRFAKGENIHSGSNDCVGMMIVKSGQLRVYILSENGREATLFRPVPGEICILSASCILKNIDFDVYIDAERDSEVYILPTTYLEQVKEMNSTVEGYVNQVLSARFSDVMWAMEQILFMSLDKRVASFLLEQAAMDGSDMLQLTHETIAGHIGSAREAVTRMLKYFAGEGMIESLRGRIRIKDKAKLEKTAAQ